MEVKVERERCRKEAIKPLCDTGTLTRDGVYYRAAKRDDFKRMYSDDPGNPPLARRLHKNFYKELGSQSENGISVNCCQCHLDPRCTLAWVGRSGLNCVIQFDLSLLSMWMGRNDIVVIYSPRGGSGNSDEDNPCHYLMMSEDGDPQELISDFTRAIHDYEKKFPEKFADAASAPEEIATLIETFRINVFKVAYGF